MTDSNQSDLSRRSLVKALGLGATASLAGCSDDGDGGAATDASGGGQDTETEASTSGKQTTSGESTTLTAASWGGDVEAGIVKDLLNEYAESTERIDVEYQNTPFGEYSKNLQTQFAGGEEPDVFYLIADDAPKIMRNGALLPLGEHVKNDADYKFDDILDNLLEPFKYDGTLYGVPKDFTTVGLFHNTKHLDAAGVSEPETWNDLRSALEAIKSSTDVTYPMAVGSQPRNTLMQLVWQNGGDVLSEDGSKAVIGSTEAIEALEFLNGLVEDDLAGIYGSDIDATWAGPALGKEMVSATMTGAWTISTLQEKYSDIYDATRVALPLPEGGEEATVVFTTSWSASANTDAPQAAANLIKTLTDEDGMWKWVKTGTALPSRKSLLEKDFYDDRPLLSGLGDLGDVGRPLVFGPKTSTILDSIMTESEAVLTGDKSPDDALKAAERQINDEL